MSSNNLPDDLTKLQSNAGLFSKLVKSMPPIQPKIESSKMPEVIIRNPNEEVEKLLNQQNNKLDEQTKELQFIRYENIKLNAQIDTLNKMIDSQNDEISKLRELRIKNCK